MKKIIGIIAFLFCVITAFSQNTKYKELLKKAKEYEAKKEYAYALGYYYDAVEADMKNCDEAHERYNTIADAIKAGKPGLGEYNSFTLYENWANLLKNAEKYWMEFPPVGIEFKDVNQKSMNVSDKTIDYEIAICTYITAKTQTFLDCVKEGLEKSYNESWTDIPYNSKFNWPYQSVYNTKDGTPIQIFKKYGVAIIANYAAWAKPVMLKTTNENYEPYSDDLKLYYFNSYFYSEERGVSYSMFIVPNFASWYTNFALLDMSLKVMNKNGVPLGTIDRWLAGGKRIIKVSADLLDMFENGEYRFQPVQAYLNYGTYDMNKDSGGRSFLKYFNETKIDASKIECSIEGIKEKVDSVFVAIEKKRKEQEEYEQRMFSILGVSNKERLVEKIIKDNTLTREYVTAFGETNVNELFNSLNEFLGYAPAYIGLKVDTSSNGFVCTSENNMNEVVAEGEVKIGNYYIHSLNSELESKIMESIRTREDEKTKLIEKQKHDMRLKILEFISKIKTSKTNIVNKLKTSKYSQEYIEERLSELQKDGFIKIDNNAKSSNLETADSKQITLAGDLIDFSYKRIVIENGAEDNLIIYNKTDSALELDFWDVESNGKLLYGGKIKIKPQKRYKGNPLSNNDLENIREFYVKVLSEEEIEIINRGRDDEDQVIDLKKVGEKAINDGIFVLTDKGKEKLKK